MLPAEERQFEDGENSADIVIWSKATQLKDVDYGQNYRV